jgi:hypothetical protein
MNKPLPSAAGGSLRERLIEAMSLSLDRADLRSLCRMIASMRERCQDPLTMQPLAAMILAFVAVTA